MKIAIISDIHANLQALEAVFKQIEKRGVDMIACLGDLVGYGSQPNEVIELIRKNADFVVMGNHDASVVGKLDYSYHYEAAKNALDWTKKIITEDNYNWLNQLPHSRKFKDIGFSHGSPITPEQFDYVYTIDHAFSLVDEYEKLPHINFIGHSHLIKGYSFSKIMVDEISLPRRGFRAQSKYLFSVGSVGQPRDGNPLAAFLIYDSDNEEVIMERVLYDITEAADRIVKAGLSPNFAKRLSLGI